MADVAIPAQLQTCQGSPENQPGCEVSSREASEPGSGRAGNSPPYLVSSNALPRPGMKNSREAAWRAAVIGSLLLFFSLYPLPASPAWQLCGFHWLAGKPCPFCGLTRSLSFLARGQWGVAVDFHPLGPLVFAALWVAFLALLWSWMFPGTTLLRFPGMLRKVFWIGCVLLFLLCGFLRLIQPAGF